MFHLIYSKIFSFKQFIHPPPPNKNKKLQEQKHFHHHGFKDQLVLVSTTEMHHSGHQQIPNTMIVLAIVILPELTRFRWVPTDTMLVLIDVI